MPLDVKGLTQAFHVNLDAKVPSNVKESHSRRLSKNSVKQYPEIFDTYPYVLSLVAECVYLYLPFSPVCGCNAAPCRTKNLPWLLMKVVWMK